MEQKIAVFQNRGMTRDISISKVNNEFAYENFNVRIIARDHDTLLSVTNERGNTPISIKDLDGKELEIKGTVLGYSVLNSYLVLFTKHEDSDYIYKLRLNEDSSWTGVILFKGNLNLDYNNPIETLSNYESEDVQKVYWVDGINQPRFLNIEESYLEKNSSIFDFVTKFDASSLNVEVSKTYNGGGKFPSGVIQYAITFSNKFKQETNIAYVTDLNYISYKDRGATAEDNVQCSFTLLISGIDKNFDYINVYSIHRSSLNSVPTVSKVITLEITEEDMNSTITVTDSGIINESIDPTVLLYMGGKEIIAGTLCQKDGTLFLGDISAKSQGVDKEITNILRASIDKNGINNLISFDYTSAPYTYPSDYYQYKNQMQYSSSEFKTFKGGEKYRFAVRFKTGTGQYTAAYWIGDQINNKYPKVNINKGEIERVYVKYTLPEEFINYNKSIESPYVSAELMMASPSDIDRSIKAQGIISPTMFNFSERHNNSPFSIPSWYMRGRNLQMESAHYMPLPINTEINAELQCSTSSNPPYVESTSSDTFVVGVYYLIEVENVGGILEGFIDYAYKYNTGKINVFKHKYSYKNRIQMVKVAEDIVRLLKELYIPVTLLPDISKLKAAFKNNRPRSGYIKIFDQNSSGKWEDVKEMTLGVTHTEYLKDIEKNNLYNAKCRYAKVSNLTDDLDNNYVTENSTNYYVDESIVTFNSPEIDDTPSTIDKSSLSFRIVGIAEITSNLTDYSINIDNKNSITDAVSTINLSTPYQSKNPTGLLSFPLYEGSNSQGDTRSYMIYPWHKEGSILSGSTDNTGGESPYSVLKSKVESNYRVSYNTVYFDGTQENFWKPLGGIYNIRSYHYDEPTLMQINTPWGNKTYQGNYDTLLICRKPLSDSDKVDTSYPLVNTGTLSISLGRDLIENQVITEVYSGDSLITDISKVKDKIIDPIRIKFKTTPHAVISFKPLHGKFVTLPPLYDVENSTLLSDYLEDVPDKHLPWQNKVEILDTIYNGMLCSYTEDYAYDAIIGEDNKITIQEYSSVIENAKRMLNEDGEELYILVKDNNITTFTKVKSINKVEEADPEETDTLESEELGYWELEIEEITYLIYYLQDISNGNTLIVKYSSEGISLEDLTESKIDYIDPVENSLGVNRDHTYLANTPYVFIGELYVDYNDSNDTRYGGISESAIKNNTFIPIGKDTYFGDSTELIGKEGDTYFQRWDCLKTYKFAEEDTNSIVDIFSCLLESHINLDGRTDNKRGISDNISSNPQNTNKMNNVYSQSNNFLSSYVLDKKFESTTYPNQITWSKEKHSNEDIDVWTNITLASILELDGDKGSVRALRKFNNSLIAFQDKGIVEILFNSRTQLATTEGVPIEIANSGKVDGKRYITDKAGCINKWSIIETKGGIYFIDNINSTISVFNGSLKNLSDEKGFKSWIGTNNSVDIWNPVDFGNFVSYWDRVNDDIYFLNSNNKKGHTVLCYNELLQQFTSFFDYGKVPMMVNIQDRFISFKNGKLWNHGVGEYSNIFGEYQDFYMLYRITPDPYGDKIFNNIEYRADMFDMNQSNSYISGEGTLTNNTFDTLEVWNEYQGNKVSINSVPPTLYPFEVKDKYPDIRRKFRIWRMNIPRDRVGVDNPYGLNRIRNPWIYLKLSKTPTLLNERMEFHDLQVRYFE